MATAKNKTVETTGSVVDFINTVEDEIKRNDCFKIIEIITTETKFEAKMWGHAIVGFGRYHYKYESGREGDAPLVGFSPRKNVIALYLSAGFDNREELLKKFGKYKAAKACIYIKRLSDIDPTILKQMVSLSVSTFKVSIRKLRSQTR